MIIYIWLYIYIYRIIYIWLYIYMIIYIYTWLYIYIYVIVYIYIHLYTYTNTRIWHYRYGMLILYQTLPLEFASWTGFRDPFPAEPWGHRSWAEFAGFMAIGGNPTWTRKWVKKMPALMWPNHNPTEDGLDTTHLSDDFWDGLWNRASGNTEGQLCSWFAIFA